MMLAHAVWLAFVIAGVATGIPVAALPQDSNPSAAINLESHTGTRNNDDRPVNPNGGEEAQEETSIPQPDNSTALGVIKMPPLYSPREGMQVNRQSGCCSFALTMRNRSMAACGMLCASNIMCDIFEFRALDEPPLLMGNETVEMGDCQFWKLNKYQPINMTEIFNPPVTSFVKKFVHVGGRRLDPNQGCATLLEKPPKLGVKDVYHLSVAACQTECDNLDDCHAFSYDRKNGTCLQYRLNREKTEVGPGKEPGTYVHIFNWMSPDYAPDPHSDVYLKSEIPYTKAPKPETQDEIDFAPKRNYDQNDWTRQSRLTAL